MSVKPEDGAVQKENQDGVCILYTRKSSVQPKRDGSRGRLANQRIRGLTELHEKARATSSGRGPHRHDSTQRGTRRGRGPPQASLWVTATAWEEVASSSADASAGTTPEGGPRGCPSRADPSHTRPVLRAACSCACDAHPARSSASSFPSPSASPPSRRLLLLLVDLRRTRSSRDSRACERASGWRTHCSTVVVRDAGKSWCWCRRNRNRCHRMANAGWGASLLDQRAL
jgi:hypothetical protein